MAYRDDELLFYKYDLGETLRGHSTEKDILAVYIDGIEIAGHHVLAAIGLDECAAEASARAGSGVPARTLGWSRTCSIVW